MKKRPTRILAVIIFSQFTGTSLWFASNAVMGDLQRTWGLKGSALTLINCIGFFMTIFSIQIANYLTTQISPNYIFLFLTPGPAFGLIHLWPLFRKKPSTGKP